MSKPKSSAKAKNVQVQLRYLARDPMYKTIKPLQWTPASLDRMGKSNVRLVPGEPETIRDVRGIKQDFDLDRNGFRYVKAPTEFKDWSSEVEIGKTFVPEMEALLRRELKGCDEILVFDFRLRQNGSESYRVRDLHYNAFAKQVHVDRTEPSVISLVRKNYEMKADHLLAGRVRLINMWRPIKHPVYDCPLAIADGGKLDIQKDVIEIDRHNLNTGEFWDTMGGAHYRKGYQWYYMSEQTEEDVLIFKNYDSDKSVPATTCLHTAFDMPASDVATDTLPRESIEVRALVFTYPDGLAPPSTPELRRRKFKSHKQLLQETGLLKAQLGSLQKEIGENKALVQAILDLREWESQKAAERLHHLMTDREHSRGEVIALNSELDFLEERITRIAMSHDYSRRDSVLIHKIEQLVRTSPRLRERFPEDQQAHQHLVQAERIHGRDAELLLLREQLEAQKAENQRLKASMNARVKDGKDEAFRDVVNEAVKQERVKDEFVIRSLRDENQNLREALYGQTALKW